MKKLFVLLVMIFILGGCSIPVKDTPPLPDLNFSGNMSVTYNDFNLVCKIDNKLATGCTVTVVEPELISGLKMTVNEGDCTFSMGDISYGIDSSFLKKTEFASKLTETFDQILITTNVHKLENGNWLYSGSTSSGKFNLVQDSLTGYPISVTIPDADLYIKFSDMKSNSK